MLCSGIRCVCVCTMQLCVCLCDGRCISFIISVCHSLALSFSLIHPLTIRSRFVILLFICSLAFCFVIVIRYWFVVLLSYTNNALALALGFVKTSASLWGFARTNDRSVDGKTQIVVWWINRDLFNFLFSMYLLSNAEPAIDQIKYFPS